MSHGAGMIANAPGGQGAAARRGPHPALSRETPRRRSTIAGGALWAGFLLAAMLATALSWTSGSAKAHAVYRQEAMSRLGLSSGRSGGRIGRSVPGDCRRWREIANGLGETYAGWRFRKTILPRACGKEIESRPDAVVWRWPWREEEPGADLPPQLHARFGAWEIRCERAGRRQRCALATRARLIGRSSGLDGSELHERLTVHFVIDRIGGRELMLLRVHATGTTWTTRKVRLRLGERLFSEAFDQCGKLGCVAESSTQRSTRAANWLWDGEAIRLRLIGADGRRQGVRLSAAGFRAGFVELVRLRREESRSFAGSRR